jgi:hypothetical protein
VAIQAFVGAELLSDCCRDVEKHPLAVVAYERHHAALPHRRDAGATAVAGATAKNDDSHSRTRVNCGAPLHAARSGE